MKNISYKMISMILLVALLAACRPPEQQATQTEAEPAAMQTAEAPTVTQTFTVTPSPTPTATATPTPTLTLTPTTTPTVTPTEDPRGIFFEDQWITLYYPKDWKVESPSCGAPGNCILRLFHSPNEDVTIEITVIPDSVFMDLPTEVDYWWQLLVYEAVEDKVVNHLKLVSRKNILVDGLPAIKVLSEHPLLDSSTNALKGIEYSYQVIVNKDQDGYVFHMQTTREDEFELYQEIADKIVATIVFPK